MLFIRCNFTELPCINNLGSLQQPILVFIDNTAKFASYRMVHSSGLDNGVHNQTTLHDMAMVVSSQMHHSVAIHIILPMGVWFIYHDDHLACLDKLCCWGRGIHQRSLSGSCLLDKGILSHIPGKSDVSMMPLFLTDDLCLFTSGEHAPAKQTWKIRRGNVGLKKDLEKFGSQIGLLVSGSMSMFKNTVGGYVMARLTPINFEDDYAKNQHFFSASHGETSEEFL